MRTLYMTIVLLGITSGAFGQDEHSVTPPSRWFQNCAEEIAKPFCGTLTITQMHLDPILHDQVKPDGHQSSVPSSKISETQRTQKLAQVKTFDEETP
jgi:hypothetical protein